MNEPVMPAEKQPEKKHMPKWLWPVLTAFILILAVVLTIVFTHAHLHRLEGEWVFHETTYHFRADKTGYMEVGKGVFTFRYQVEKDRVSIDFDSDSINDCSYRFQVKGQTLILDGEQGTVGGRYELKKK